MKNKRGIATNSIIISRKIGELMKFVPEFQRAKNGLWNK